jgi:hypothetical protein
MHSLNQFWFISLLLCLYVSTATQAMSLEAVLKGKNGRKFFISNTSNQETEASFVWNKLLLNEVADLSCQPVVLHIKATEYIKATKMAASMVTLLIEGRYVGAYCEKPIKENMTIVWGSTRQMSISKGWYTLDLTPRKLEKLAKIVDQFVPDTSAEKSLIRQAD